jgi:hypothetical protein
LNTSLVYDKWEYTMEKPASAKASRLSVDFDLESLPHPARAFDHPRHVIDDLDLTLNEKRAILASWASDACAIEAAPELRWAPGTKQPIRFDDVMEALRALDQIAGDHAPPRYRRILANRVPGMFGRESREPGTRGQLVN